MRLELIEGKLSRSVPRGLGGSNPTWLLDAGRKGRKDLARSLPSCNVLGALFLGDVSSAFCLQRRHVGHTNFGTWGLANSIPSFFRHPRPASAGTFPITLVYRKWG